MKHKKPTSEKKIFQPDYEALWEVKPVRIVVSVVAVLAGIYVSGKMLRLMGQTIEDVRFFTTAVKKK